ncbi:MAG: hypothetical protein ABGZ35_13150, partial [Planctomycetaceae bacterium]
VDCRQLAWLHSPLLDVDAATLERQLGSRQVLPDNRQSVYLIRATAKLTDDSTTMVTIEWS